MSAERWALGWMESTFLCALNDSSQAPPGFEAKRFEAAREQLHAKRLRMMARAWPSLPQALGDDWRRQAWAILRAVPRRGGTHAVTDGFVVAQRLEMRGPLPPDLRIRMLRVRVLYRWRAGELVSRRQPAWLLELVSWALGASYAAYLAGGPKQPFVRGEDI